MNFYLSITITTLILFFLLLYILHNEQDTFSSTNIIIIITLVVVLLTLFYKYNDYDITSVKSQLDGEQYLVRNLPDKQQASNMLAKIHKNMMYLTNYLYNNINKYKKHEADIKQLKERMETCIIMESTENNIYTSYSVNKGEQIVFCLRSRNALDKDKLHDINLLMYVVLHEMAHVACPEYGHTPLFKEIFGLLTTTAIELGIYKKIDFNANNTEYCGLMITDSII